MTSQIHSLDLDRTDRVAVAALSGEVDMSNATPIRQRIAEFMTQEDEALILDLSELSFIDSAGLHAVFGLSAVLEEKRQLLILVVPPGSQVERTLEVVGMPGTISVHFDRAAAIRAAHASDRSRPAARSDDP
jgi:anti-sigma B factor antagonist